MLSHLRYLGGNQQRRTTRMKHLTKAFLTNESGASAIEYGLLAAILGIGLVYSLTNLQIALSDLFGVVENHVPDVGTN